MTEYVTIEKKVYDKLVQTVKELTKQLEELQKRLWVYENPNIPSGKRIIKEKKEEKETTEESTKRGAPEGHVGATRKRPKPNRFIDLKPNSCTNCNSGNIEINNKETRLIEDIRIEKVVTQFTQYEYHCNDCGKDYTTTHPELPKEGIFGPTITSIWETLHYLGHIPFDALSQITGNLFDMRISEGGAHNVVYRTAQIFEPTFEEIKKGITESDYVRSDETSYPFNGINWWLWNLSNKDASLVLLNNSRGSSVIEGVIGTQFDGVLNTDCLPVYDNVGVGLHQKSWSQLLRFAEVAADEDVYGKKVHEMLQEMFAYIKHVKMDHLEGTPNVVNHIERMKKRIRYLKRDKRRSKITERLVKRLKKHVDSWFTCLLFDFVEPTNNASERDIRKNVIARKISGQHRSVMGTHCREIMMSTILTKQKNNVNVFDFIRQGIRNYNSASDGS
jgi:transposase